MPLSISVALRLSVKAWTISVSSLVMLRFLDPMMTQQALELRVEIFVVANAFEIVLLRHPLDSQDYECHTQRAVGKTAFPISSGGPIVSQFVTKPSLNSSANF